LLTITLGNDSDGNVIAMNFVVIDNQGNVAAPPPVNVKALSTASDIAPVFYGQLVLVGQDEYQTAPLSSGAGMITFTTGLSQSLIAEPFEFVSADPTPPGGTGERANSIYGAVPAGSRTQFAQFFGYLANDRG
jgi:hypothetical protein